MEFEDFTSNSRQKKEVIVIVYLGLYCTFAYFSAVIVWADHSLTIKHPLPQYFV